MILDSLDNFGKYTGLSPLFADVLQFLKDNDLGTMPVGRYDIKGEDLYVNIVDSQPKRKEDAPLETHNRMIDIQIPISARETHGYAPIMKKDPAIYDEAGDISFHKNVCCTTYMDVQPGQFVVYFPNDGHAPAITDVMLRKAIFKVKQ